ncbi:MAG: nickel pincer cofactor biosynthesis protein LarC [Nitrospirae bacterium]|nr:MAG: nickel pincer cofactor biosynthesis protein LarC [Nitrospirota bacterium]
MWHARESHNTARPSWSTHSKGPGALLISAGMRIAYFDCFSGVSGDMCLGALVDAGLPLADLVKGLEGLRLRGFSLRSRRVARGALSGTKVDVLVEKGHDRMLNWRDVHRALTAAHLPEPVRDRSLAVFDRLAKAEGRAHRTPATRAQLHEIGDLDSLVDVAGTVLGCHLLGVEALYVSAINVGTGTSKTEHGVLPAPGPATAALLKGLPVYATGPRFELTTPTGAALMATLSAGAGAMPAMTVMSIGYGAGEADPPGWPNALRVFVGETLAPTEFDRVAVLETNLDDMNPQGYDLLIERLLARGALDVTLTPVIMKRGRPGIVLNVLTDPAKVEPMLKVLFAETTTLGVRVQEVARRLLARELTEVATRFGPVRVKVAKAGGRSVKARPEYQDCKRIAEQTGLPLRDVVREVERALRRLRS